MPCPKGYRPKHGGCYDKQGKKYEPSAETSSDGKVPATQPNEIKQKAPEQSKDKGPSKLSIAGKIMSQAGGNAVKFFNDKAKARFKLGIPCPAGLSKNICKLWGIPHKVMHGVYNQMGGLYQSALQIKNEGEKEAKTIGYDKAIELTDDTIEQEAGMTGVLTMKNLKAIDDKATARQKQLIEVYGADALKRPRGRELIEARAEFDALGTVVRTSRAQTSKLKNEQSTVQSPIFQANVQRGATLIAPSGKKIDPETLRQARKK